MDNNHHNHICVLLRLHAVGPDTVDRLVGGKFHGGGLASGIAMLIILEVQRSKSTAEHLPLAGGVSLHISAAGLPSSSEHSVVGSSAEGTGLGGSC